MSSNNIISVIIPCYNQGIYLDECLQSVLDQIYTNWECIVVNDGSTDNTEELALKWTKKDSRYKYLYKKNGGLSSARNAGIEKAKGEFILPLDADDKISSDYIKLALEAFQKDSELKLVYCKAEKFGKINSLWKLEPFSLKNLAETNIIFCSGIYKKKDWNNIGGYDTNMIYGLEDWEFWIHLLKNGGEVFTINKICFYYRVKNVSMITNLNQFQQKEMIKYISIKHVDFFIKYLGTFHDLNNKINIEKKLLESKLKSKKYVLKLFLKTFFKINI